MKRLEGKRVLVIGASAGIGRAIAIAAGEAGARVAIAARRAEQLRAVAAEVPGGAATIACDVRDAARCEAAVAEAAAALGGLDALVYATGLARLVPVAEADAETWRAILDTNVVGASLVTRAALPHLVESRGRALYLSSISSEDRPPRSALGVYIVSKAALNRLVDAWQSEHRAVSFTRLNVGDTHATEMGSTWADDFGTDTLGHHVGQWQERDYMFGRTMKPEAVARHCVDLLAAEEAIPVSTIQPRYAG